MNKNKSFEEIVRTVLPCVAEVNRAVTRPIIEKKTGIRVVSEGANFAELVTNVDLSVSQALLEGAPELGVVGLRTLYPGSFSEEQDSPDRQTALTIYEVDPIDGTGDLKKTYGTNQVMSPTTLVTKLTRTSLDAPFTAVAGFIFDIVHEYALVAVDGCLSFFAVNNDGSIVEIPIILQTPHWTPGQPFTLNRRSSYPQETYDVRFMEFLRRTGLDPRPTATGGAGMQALQFFRSFIELDDDRLGHLPAVKAFLDLDPLALIFNCQPDWKTWDVDPSRLIAGAIAQNAECHFGNDIFGNALAGNASEETTKEMWHRCGCVFSTSARLAEAMYRAARAFHDPDDPERDLLSVNY